MGCCVDMFGLGAWITFFVKRWSSLRNLVLPAFFTCRLPSFLNSVQKPLGRSKHGVPGRPISKSFEGNGSQTSYCQKVVTDTMPEWTPCCEIWVLVWTRGFQYVEITYRNFSVETNINVIVFARMWVCTYIYTQHTCFLTLLMEQARMQPSVSLLLLQILVLRHQSLLRGTTYL